MRPSSRAAGSRRADRGESLECLGHPEPSRVRGLCIDRADANVNTKSCKPNAQYNVARPDSLAVRVAGMMRRRMYDEFLAVGGVEASESILEVGVTSDRSYASSNYLVSWYPHKERLVAVGLDDACFIEQAYPGVRFLFGDGKALPFADGAFDVVHSSAVIEHVGSRAEQARFIRELSRVSRRLVCLTTPNRWFPVEVHTGLPLLHWLPSATFRAVLAESGRAFFADERNLNLLSRTDLLTLCHEAGVAKAEIRGLRLSGWTSNLMLFLRR